MRVLHLIARLNDGGPARVIAQLAHTLPVHGFTIEVAAGRCALGEGDLGPRLRAEGLAIIDVPELGRTPSLLRDVRALLRVVRLIREHRPALVHTHTAKAGALGRIACRVLGVPCLHTYHGHVLDGYFSPLMNRVVHISERLLAGDGYHHALTPSQGRDLARVHAIGRRSRWQVLPVPVASVTPTTATWQRELRSGVPVVGFLGRLTAVKDVDLWLATLAEIQRHHAVQGVICGGGPERVRLENVARHSKLPVFFTGAVPAGEALAVMDVLLMTSRNEGLPLVAMEAAGCRIPVVAPAVGGLADLIQWGAVEGAARTPDGLAAACIRMLDDRVARQRRTMLAAVMAGRLDPVRMAGAYAEMYRSIISAAHCRVVQG